MLGLAQCTRCKLCREGRPVPGAGPVPADWMVIGEAPGAEEVAQGLPFVGRAGKLLRNLLKFAGLNEDEVYITNAIKHRPPANRRPHKDEYESCMVWLRQELMLVQPKYLIVLGQTACRVVLGKFPTLTNEHGIAREVRIPWLGKTLVVVPMYHPAAALRDPRLKGILAEDFYRLKEEVAKLEKRYLTTKDYRLATDEDAISLVRNAEEFAFDLETTAPTRGSRFSPLEAEIIGYSVAVWTGPDQVEAIYVPNPPHALKPYLEDGDKVKVCHNAKFEVGRLRDVGIRLRNYHDTKLMAYVLGLPNTTLKGLARQLLRVEVLEYDDVAKGRSLAEVFPLFVAPYAAADAENTLRLKPILRKMLLEAGLWDVYNDIDLPVVDVLEEMEREGVGLHQHRTRRLLERLAAERAKARQEAIDAGLPPVNLDSHEQLANALESIGAPIAERTEAKGLLSTREVALERAREWNPGLVDALLRYRRLGKLAAYLKGWLELVHPDGRLHPQYRHAGGYEEGRDDSTAPATGRLACVAPNLQNIPHHFLGAPPEWEEYGREMRKCLVPREGHVFVVGDIAQEEPRILALASRDARMLQELKEGRSPYLGVAEAIYGRPISKAADPHEYHAAKTFFLAVWYGGGAEELTKVDPNLTLEQANAGLRRIYQLYPGIRRLREYVAAKLRASGEIRDLFCRRRLLPGAFGDPIQREQALREAVNHIAQGTAASVLKIVLRRLYDAGYKPVLVVHDEVVLEVPAGKARDAVETLKRSTEGILVVDLPVEVRVGTSYGELCDAD